MNVQGMPVGVVSPETGGSCVLGKYYMAASWCVGAGTGWASEQEWRNNCQDGCEGV